MEYLVETITALHRNYYGKIISFITSEGRVISYQKAIMEAEKGLLAGVHVEMGPEGNPCLLPEHEQDFDHYPNLF